MSARVVKPRYVDSYVVGTQDEHFIRPNQCTLNPIPRMLGFPISLFKMSAFWVHRWFDLTSCALGPCSVGTTLRRSITYPVLGARLVDHGATVAPIRLVALCLPPGRPLDVPGQTLAVAVAVAPPKLADRAVLYLAT